MTLSRNYIPMKSDTAVKEPFHIKIFLCLMTDKSFSCIPSQKKKQLFPSPLFIFTMYLSFSLPNSSSGSETMVKNMAVDHSQLDIKILWGHITVLPTSLSSYDERTLISLRPHQLLFSMSTIYPSLTILFSLIKTNQSSLASISKARRSVFAP